MRWTSSGQPGRLYYKNVLGDVPWDQPVLTANGTPGGADVAVSASSEVQANGGTFRAWQAMNNADGAGVWRSGTKSGWYQVYTPEPIKIEKILWTYQYCYPTSGSVIATNNPELDPEDWDVLCTWTQDKAANFFINCNSTEYYTYHRVVVNGVSSDYIHCEYFGITAVRAAQISVLADASDYDYYVDMPEGETTLLFATNQLQTLETPWVQPVLTANGTMGGNSFAVSGIAAASGYGLWKAFDGDPATWFGTQQSSGNRQRWINFYNPTPIRVSRLTVTNSSSTSETSLRDYSVTYSDTGEDGSWVTVASGSAANVGANAVNVIDIPASAGHHKYWGLDCDLTAYPSQQYWDVADIHIDASFVPMVGAKLYAHAASNVTRRYFKDDLQVFEQPTLSANGTVGGTSFAVNTHVYAGSWSQPVWKAFDGNESTYAEYGSSGSNGSNAQTIRMYNPTPIKVSSIVIKQGSSYPAKYIDWAYSDDGSTWSPDVRATLSGAINSTDTITIGAEFGEHRYWRIINAKTWGGENDDWSSSASHTRGRWRISEITINATTGGITEITNPTSPADYDYYTDTVTTNLYGAHIS